MVPIAPYYGDIVQVALAVVSAILMVISINAYKRRPEGRYLLLMLAFIFLCIISVTTALLELFVGVGPATIQLVEFYLNPSLELLMVVSFLVALMWSSKAKRRVTLAFLAMTITITLVASTSYVSGPGGAYNSGAGSPLPAGCVKPAGGFLIIGSSLGYNDSIAHGGPVKPWPVLHVSNGSNVIITVCNTYVEALGFQVEHYLDGKIEALQPGQVTTLRFVADQPGTFLMYCSIFSPIHIYLQGGEVKVT